MSKPPFDRTVAESWQAFEAAVLGPAPREIQRTAMKKAFYSGAWLIARTVHRLGEGDVSDDQAYSVLSRLMDELDSWVREQTSVPREWSEP